MIMMDPGDLGSLKSPISPSPNSRMLSPSVKSTMHVSATPEDQRRYETLSQRKGSLHKVTAANQHKTAMNIAQ